MLQRSVTRPYWAAAAQCPEYPPPAGDSRVDVAVVGAGITGLTAAMLLLEAGKSVAVIEMNRVGSGTTGRSTGHADVWLDEGIAKILGAFGEDSTRKLVEARLAAVKLIGSWDSRYQLHAEFVTVPGYLYSEDDEGLRQLDREAEAALKLGLPVKRLDAAPLPFPARGAVMMDGQARFSPLAYACSLAGAVAARGGAVHEDTRAEDIAEEDGEVRIATSHGIVAAGHAVIAGHAPLLGALSVAARVRPYQSYVLAARVRVPMEDALYWDTAEPYHYTRVASSADPRMVIAGGADHETGAKIDAAESFDVLERYLRERYDVESVENRWSHEYFVPADGLPYVGIAPTFERVLIATGYSGDGLSYGTLAGALMSDIVLGRENALADVLRPSRVKPLASVERLGANILHVAGRLVRDRLSGGEVETVDGVPAGEGRLVAVRGERYAVYKDDAGKVTSLASVCTHMGCVVRWNSAEKTWDCPCHGSRFDTTGRVVMGPAKVPLERREIKP